MLQSDFVLGWKNIKREKHVGSSFGYSKRDSSVGTTNGAGSYNVQIFVLSPDNVVLHALPGFWHPEDLARELQFAKVLGRLWTDASKTREQKLAMFPRIQLAALRSHPEETYARSRWQGFDSRVELQKLRTSKRDTFFAVWDGEPVKDERGMPKMKPINVLVHERMATRPFLKFEQFDVANFVDYGQRFYDNNIRVDGRGKKIARR